MKCKKCEGRMLMQYDDIVCANCGWRETPVELQFMLTVMVARGHEKHYDLTSKGDRRTVAKWLKRCVGSGKLGKYLREKYVRCIACNREIEPTMSGRVPKHLPSKWFAQRIMSLLSIKNYDIQKGNYHE